jgi:hypothetical protein
MPQALLAILPGLLTGGAAAAGTAASIYSSLQGPDSPSTPNPAEVTKQAVDTETLRRGTATKEASQFLPQLQANTSGGLSPDALQQFSSSFSGNADLGNSPQMKELVAKFLGLDTGATFGGTGSFGTGASNPASPGLTG